MPVSHTRRVLSASLTFLITGAALQLWGVVLIALEVSDTGKLINNFVTEWEASHQPMMVTSPQWNDSKLAELIVNLNYTGSRARRSLSVLLILLGITSSLLGSCLSLGA